VKSANSTEEKTWTEITDSEKEGRVEG